MTESEFRRRPSADRLGAALRHRLELVDDALLGIVGYIACGNTPADEAERKERARCVLVAERIAAKARRLLGGLASPASMESGVTPDGRRLSALVGPPPDAAAEREVARYWTREARLAAQERGEPRLEARVVAEQDRVIDKARGTVTLSAREAAEQNRRLDEARDREWGEEP